MKTMRPFFLFFLAFSAFATGKADVVCEGYGSVSPGPLLYLCPGDSLELTAGGFLTQNFWHWSTGEQGTQIVVTQPGHYWANDGGCVTAYADVIAWDEGLTHFYYQDTICPGGVINLYAPIGNGNRLWSNGSGASFIQVTTPGHYEVTITLSCGVVTAEFDVFFFPAVPMQMPDTTICPGESITLACPDPEPNNFQWSTGAQGAQISVMLPGLYTATKMYPCTRTYQFRVLPGTDCLVPLCAPQFASVISFSGEDPVEVWQARADCYYDTWDLRLYNAQGSEVFRSTDYRTGWDGSTPQQEAGAGIYFYSLQYRTGTQSGSHRGKLMVLR